MNLIRQTIALFIALTFMTMAFIPCADSCDIKTHQNESSIKSAQDHHEEHSDMCSPLCSCECCSTQITIFKSTSITFLPNSYQELYLIFKQPFVSSFHSAIWQPPKIS